MLANFQICISVPLTIPRFPRKSKNRVLLRQAVKACTDVSRAWSLSTNKPNHMEATQLVKQKQSLSCQQAVVVVNK